MKTKENESEKEIQIIKKVHSFQNYFYHLALNKDALPIHDKSNVAHI